MVKFVRTMSYNLLSRTGSRSAPPRLQCRVVLLDNSEFCTTFDSRERVEGHALFDEVCEKAQIPVNLRRYFGLQYMERKDGEMSWLLLDKPLRPSNKNKKIKDLQLAVKMFPKDTIKFYETVQTTRLLVLQLKYLLNRGKLHLPINKHAILDSYFAQAELGDHSDKTHGYGYLEGLLGSTFFSHPSYLNSNFDISEAVYEAMVTDLHKSRKGMTTKESLMAYTELCQSVQGYGKFIHNGATDDKGNNVIFVMCSQGLQVFLPNEFREPGEVLHDFPWETVLSMMCNKAKFYLTVKSTNNNAYSPEVIHTFRFHGHFGYLQAERLVTECQNHKAIAFDVATLEKKEKRSKSMEDITRANSLAVPLARRSRIHSPMASLKKQMRVDQGGHY